MKGGKLIWLIDQMQVTMDSLGQHGETIALARDLKIDDMLFRYGIRINYDLIQDLVSSEIPVVTGYVGNQPKQQLMPWYYFPVMTPDSKHPIVNNLNAIKGEFVSSIDTISSGDDMLLMKKIADRFPKSVFYLLSKRRILHE